MKKKYFIILLILLFILFKNDLYFFAFSYKKTQTIYSVESTVMNNDNYSKKILNLDSLIDICLKQTNLLSFEYKNDLKNNKANCIGYAFLFKFYFNNLSKKNSLPYRAHHIRGNIFFLSFDLNKIFTNPFFKNHDYIEIENINSNEKIFLDPSLHDYTGIRYVRNYR